jgi:hypothetical protein
MDGKATATRPSGSTRFWHSLRRGPWPERTLHRLVAALDELARALRAVEGVAGLVLFGSYARGDFGRKSDVDLLVVLKGRESAPIEPVRQDVLRLLGEVEYRHRLPMHLAPLMASVHDPAALGPELLHSVWEDGVILYAEAGALAQLRPTELAPWTLFRFSQPHATAVDRVRLSRRLYGVGGRPGIVRPPGLPIGRGAVLVPGGEAQAVRDTLEEAGAVYDAIPVWREG